MKKNFSLSLFVLIIILSGCVIGSKKTEKTEELALLTGNSTGVTTDEILIGSSAAMSGHVAYLGASFMQGAEARINEINEAGGINGRKIKLVVYDDQYDPIKCVQNTDKLINQDKVFALFNFVGSPTTLQVLPLIEKNRIPLVGVLSGAQALREPLKNYVFNIRTSYYVETELAIKYFVDILGFKKISVFYQADAYGVDGLNGVKEALAKRNLAVNSQGSYQRGTSDVEEAARIINESDPEAVIMVGVYSPTAKFVKLVKEKNSAVKFSSVSFVGPEMLASELGADAEGVLVTQVVPPLNVMDVLEGIRMYKDALAKYFPGAEPSVGGLEGYINSRALEAGLKKSGKKLTREKFISTLEEQEGISLGIGNGLSYKPYDHSGLKRAFLSYIHNGKFFLYSEGLDMDSEGLSR